MEARRYISEEGPTQGNGPEKKRAPNLFPKGKRPPSFVAAPPRRKEGKKGTIKKHTTHGSQAPTKNLSGEEKNN